MTTKLLSDKSDVESIIDYIKGIKLENPSDYNSDEHEYNKQLSELEDNKITIIYQMLNIFWDKITKIPPNILTNFKEQVEKRLYQFGTSLYENRPIMGGLIEHSLLKMFKNSDFYTIPKPQAKRIDCEIDGIEWSIKWSSTGNIKLHNSNNCSNKDIKMVNTILITTNGIYFIVPDIMHMFNIQLIDSENNKNSLLKNVGDGLSLQRNILQQLKKNKYPFIIDIKINYHRNNCSHISIIKYILDMEEKLKMI